MNPNGSRQMPTKMPPNRPSGTPRAPLLPTALAIGVLLAGCGASSPHPATVTAGGTTTAASRSATSGAAGSTATASGTGVPSALAFAKCMRANGVSNFPDPAPGGGSVFDTAGINPAAPAFKAAQAKCQKLLPSSGSGPAFSERSYLEVRKVAVCMRAHGISDFPDPKIAATGRLPTPPPGISMITDYDGALLEFPATLNMQSPAYKQAAAACGPLAQKIGLGHPH